MEIAIIGSGISGLSAAWLLSRRHNVRLFERQSRLGGHTNTIEAGRNGRTLPLDTGFIVFNRETYPNLVRLFDVLGVASRESDMSFSVTCRRCGLEYCGTGLSGLFAQPANLFRLSFLAMLKDIVRFNRIAPLLLTEAGAEDITLGLYLEREGFSRPMRDHYLFPMAAAVWSAGTQTIGEFPAALLVRFFRNHGFLGVDTQYRWRTVTGGSRTYVQAMTRDIADRVHTGTPVTSVRRDGSAVTLGFFDGSTQRFDCAVLATHADESLAVLADPTPDETRLLSAWTFSTNDTWLHTDESFLPARPGARASWNYHLVDCSLPRRDVSVTYHLNRLQGLSEPTSYLVTLNPERPLAAGTALARIPYTHPVYTRQSLATQAELPRLNGQKNTFFCGAWMGDGFHEDGLKSGIAVAEALGVSFP